MYHGCGNTASCQEEEARVSWLRQHCQLSGGGGGSCVMAAATLPAVRVWSDVDVNGCSENFAGTFIKTDEDFFITHP